MASSREWPGELRSREGVHRYNHSHIHHSNTAVGLLARSGAGGWLCVCGQCTAESSRAESGGWSWHCSTVASPSHLTPRSTNRNSYMDPRGRGGCGRERHALEEPLASRQHAHETTARVLVLMMDLTVLRHGCDLARQCRHCAPTPPRPFRHRGALATHERRHSLATSSSNILRKHTRQLHARSLSVLRPTGAQRGGSRRVVG